MRKYSLFSCDEPVLSAHMLWRVLLHRLWRREVGSSLWRSVNRATYDTIAAAVDPESGGIIRGAVESACRELQHDDT